ncbi:MAG: class I SAM-dependent rRNA methyltransferase [Candidatus Methylomirabilia bacterium]
MPGASVRLQSGHDKTVREGHPWVFSGAVGHVGGDPASGEVVRVLDARGDFIAWGHYSQGSRIRVRLLERREDAVVDEAWWAERLSAAVGRRREQLLDPRGACRLVFSEADLLPGLVIDRYGDHCVLQVHTPGAERMRATTLERLGALLSPAAILDRSDEEQRRLEGLPAVDPANTTAGPDRAPSVRISDAGLSFDVSLGEGQKTGFYIDQRLNRAAVAGWASGRRVLDAFCYTGAFSVHAARAGAAGITLLDSSREALDAAVAHLALNGFAAVPTEVRRGNAFAELRRLRDEGRSFDMVILDPPRLAPTRSQAPKAARAYKDANLFAMKLLAPEGILATFSCSGGIEPAFFQEIVRWAAKDAGREVQVLEKLGQPFDHPVRLDLPETEYLKGLICRVL